jgi:hypothetical protein
MYAIAKASRIMLPGLCLVLACLYLPFSQAQSVQSMREMHSAASADAQQSASALDHRIISLAAAQRPRGAILARLPGDSTFEHAPANYHVFAAANMGEDAGVEVLTLNFAAETRLTKIQSKNKDFVVEAGGTCHEGNFYSRGNSCSLLVRFNPQGPGHRLGFVTVTHTAEAMPMSFGLTGNGYAPVVSFTPSQITTVPSSVSSGTGTINGATRMAIDGGDILYIADTGNNKVKEMDSTGTIIIDPSSPIATPLSIAVDSFGILYTANTPGSTYYFSTYYPWGSQTAYGYTYAAGACTPSAPCPFSTVGMSKPANMSMDAYDNLFFEEATKGAAVTPVSSISGGSGSFNLWYLSDQFAYNSATPASFAVDANGNLYTKYNYSTTVCYLVEEPLYNAEYSPTSNRVAGGVACGFTGDGGLARSAEISSTIGQIAFDTAGNLYFADAGNQRVRRIDAATGIISTIAGSGTAGFAGDSGAATLATLSNPSGVAVDSQGQVYILSNAPTAGPTQALRKVGATGLWNFGSILRGTTTAAKVFTVANTGNDSLILSANASITGTNASDFSIDPATTNCVLTAAATILPGRSCKLGIVFKPAASGARSASLVLHDNSINGSNTILLSGTGTLPAPVFTITSPANGTSFKTGTAITFSVSVKSTSGTQPTGTVQFLVDNANYGAAVALSSTGTASTSVTGLTIATHTLSAKYSGDANYAAAGPVSVSSIVTAVAVKLPSVVTLSVAARPANSCSIPQFAVTVSSGSGPVPTGAVNLLDGGQMWAAGSLSNGRALLSPRRLLAGSHRLTASYAGDATHDPAVSSDLVQQISALDSCTGWKVPKGGTARQAEF